MADIIQFTPRAELNATQNLVEFVRQCRDELTALGADLPFDANMWDISAHIRLPGKTKKVNAVFSSFEAAKKCRSTPCMSGQFLPFAKAYFRYMHALRPTKSIGGRLAALRALDHALCAQGHDGQATAVTHEVLNNACTLIIDSYTQAVAARVAGQLESIGRFLIEKHLVQMKSKWVKPMRRPRDIDIRVGKAADNARLKKMPSAAAIEAMAHVFVNAVSPVEIVVGSTLALLHCAPQRLNETVRLEHNCEVEALDTEERIQYGLRWPGSKGFDNSVKWIVPTMVDVARRSIANLIAASAEARKIALWYEKNPKRIYLPEAAEYLRSNDRLTAGEVYQVLYGRDDAVRGKSWCQTRKLKYRGHGGYSFAEVESCVLNMLPKSFPYAQPDLKFSDALFVARRFEFDATLSTYTCMIDYVSADQISNRLGEGKSAKSVFWRFNLMEDNGTRISLATHQVRHYLNTLAQSNGVSQLDIAMWSGRADVSQNKTYDHTSPSLILSNLRELAVSAKSALFGGDLSIPKVRVLASRDTSGKLRNLTAHITDYGMCTHDYAQSPCQIHLDCLNCNELVCVKGDKVKTKNIRNLRDVTEKLLREAEEAEQIQVYGASRWVKHQRRTLDHCTQLLSILDSPAVEVGALVKLSGIQPASRIAQAEEQRSGTPYAGIPLRKNKLLERVKRG